jgi:plastocyanin
VGIARSARGIVVPLLCLASAGSAFAGPISGVVRTTVRDGAVAATSIVYAEPIGVQAARQPGRFSLRQKNKTFLPRVLGIPVGSSVDFPNDDTIFHNVFSLAGPEPFDLGLYRSGESPKRTFAQPGLYRVFCNIHPQMSALILVVPTPYVALAARDGRFILDVPAGRYRVTALSERASAVSVEVVAEAGAIVAPDLRLDESGWVSIEHKNKFGQDYPISAYKH